MSLKYTIDDLFDNDLPESVELPELENTPASQNIFTESISGDVLIGGELASKIQDKNEQLYIAGEAIDASSTPMAVYKDSSDGFVYKTDADVAGKRKFFGFAKSGENVNSGESIKVIIEGKVVGFTGLTSGQFIYLTDTAGSISHTSSTSSVIRVGMAVSTTEIVIVSNPRKIASGSSSVSPTTSVVTNTITVGWRPKLIIAFSTAGEYGSSENDNQVVCSGSFSDISGMGYVGIRNLGNIYNESGYVCRSQAGISGNMGITMGAITETGFNIIFTPTSGTWATRGSVIYAVFGE